MLVLQGCAGGGIIPQSHSFSLTCVAGNGRDLWRVDNTVAHIPLPHSTTVVYPCAASIQSMLQDPFDTQTRIILQDKCAKDNAGAKIGATNA